MHSRTIIVTAAAGGIGSATASALAASGHSLVLVDVDGNGLRRVGLELNRSATVETVEADVTDETQVAALVDRAVVRFGQIDGLVNVVGGGMAGRKAPDVSRSNWDQVLSLSLTSTFLMCREVIPHLERQGGGAIVNVSSMAAIRGMHESPAYCAAKGGVIGLTRALALDHGSAGIRVNCVAPGAVATPALRRTRTREQVAALGAGALVGRVAEPHEIASVIHWLLSDYASYMMGKVLEVDGGLPTLA